MTSSNDNRFVRNIAAQVIERINNKHIQNISEPECKKLLSEVLRARSDCLRETRTYLYRNIYRVVKEKLRPKKVARKKIKTRMNSSETARYLGITDEELFLGATHHEQELCNNLPVD